MSDVMGPNGPESNLPIVFERDGRVFANSRDVAAFFGKRHADVLRAIEALGCSLEFTERNFAFSTYNDSTGRSLPCCDMTKDGFAFLVMGFTGSEAARFKEAYIGQFNAMEAALKNPLAGFVIPRTMSEALRLAADQQDTIERQKIELAMAAPKLDVYNRIANADGLFNLTTAAKVLSQPPHQFCRWLVAQAWIYKRAGAKSYTAYQDKIYRGYLEHKTTTVIRPDGTEKAADQVMITPKGIVKLGAMLGVKPDMDQFHLQAAE